MKKPEMLIELLAKVRRTNVQKGTGHVISKGWNPGWTKVAEQLLAEKKLRQRNGELFVVEDLTEEKRAWKEAQAAKKVKAPKVVTPKAPKAAKVITKPAAIVTPSPTATPVVQSVVTPVATSSPVSTPSPSTPGKKFRKSRFETPAQTASISSDVTAEAVAKADIVNENREALKAELLAEIAAQNGRTVTL